MGGLLKIALTKGSAPEEMEFKDIIYWVKQILGLAIGIAFGIFKLQGIVSILIGLAALSGISILYSKRYLEVDEDEIENSQLFTEGIGIGAASFMVN